MSDKRFTFGGWAKYPTVLIIDNDKGIEYNSEECCELLNNLHIKNEFLEAHNKALSHTNRELHNKLREYEELLEKTLEYYEDDDKLLFNDKEYPLISVYNLEDKINLIMSLLVELNVTARTEDYDTDWREYKYGRLIGLCERLGCDMTYCKDENDYDKRTYENYKEGTLR